MTKKLGDLVQLKSGGPLMTITEPARYGHAWKCSWFNQNGDGSINPDCYQSYFGDEALILRKDHPSAIKEETT